MRHIAYPLTLALLLVTFAPFAAAVYEEGQEACPPDQMCATSTEDDPASEPVDNSTADGTADDDVHYADDGDSDEPIPYGEEPWASGPTEDDGEDQSHAPVLEDGDGAEAEDANIPGLAIPILLSAFALVGAFWRRS